MAECLSCHQEMTGHVGCLIIEYGINGTYWTRIPNDVQPPRDCHDCGAPPGELHHPGCDSESCPLCGGQAIACGCGDDGV